MRIESVEIRRSTAFGSLLLIHRAARADRGQPHHLFDLLRNVPGVVGQVVLTQDRKRWTDGQDWIADRLGDLILRISDRSSAPANWPLLETLSQTMCDWSGAAPGLRVLDLHAGSGTLGLPIARRGALVTEVEANPYALADARHAAKANHIGRSRFRPLRAETMLKTVQPGEYDLVLLAPSQTGLSPECLTELSRAGAGRLFYLSCDPATLARDLGRLCEGGYRIARLQPFDMAPQTAQVDTLVELVR
jgi:23S rRNA (uracil1939-C5)-methyltransferase